jgi:hypothetical protein
MRRISRPRIKSFRRFLTNRATSDKTHISVTGAFQFLSLPAEIRLMIYSYAFASPCGSATVLISRSSVPQNKSHFSDTRIPGSSFRLEYGLLEGPNFPVALLQVNWQIYAEALPFLYKEVIFVPFQTSTNLPYFLGTLSQLARSSIRHIQLNVSHLITGNVRSEREYLGWAVTCAEISRLPGLCDVTVMYRYIEELNDYSVDFHRVRYAKSLILIRAKKLLAFEFNYTADAKAEVEPRFREIFSVTEQ